MSATTKEAAPRSTRERILDAACEVIATDGIDDARIARVARVAGVSTALVHYHFETRDALLAEALEHSFDLAATVRIGPEDDAADAERSVARRLADMVEQSLPGNDIERREWQLWVELWLRAARDESLRPIAARMYERYRTWIAGAIADGVAAGEFAAVDPDATADLAMALIDGMGVRALLGDPAMPLAAARARIGTVLAGELGMPAGRLPFASDDHHHADHGGTT